MKKLFCILLLLLSVGANAQQAHNLTGVVTDEKGVPLPGAVVFLTGTRYNTATANNGKFGFGSLPAGNYELVVKMIGYIPFIQKVTVGEKDATVNAVLKEDNVLLNTVTIKSADPNRDEYLKTFIKYFIGESTHASQCTITNPQVLNFHYDKQTGVLEATAGKFLTIQNEGLGYRLNYLLTGFRFDANNLTFSYSGYPYFEELPGSAARESRWAQSRKEAYAGSYHHFFRSVYSHTAEAEGFLIYPLTDKVARMKLPPVSPVASGLVFTGFNANSVQLAPAYNQRTADDTTALYVFYKSGREPRSFVNSGIYVQSPVKLPGHGQLSRIEPVSDHIKVDQNGVLTPEKSFLVSGYWAWEKVAELLPVDYGAGQPAAQQVIAPTETNQVIAFEQGHVFDELITNFKTHAAYHAIEKIYLHLNKPWYNRADTIWFKAYTVMAGNKPTDISNVAYAELINHKDTIVQRLKLKLQNGMAQGYFALPIDIAPGRYRIRAYTNWMRNNDEQYFYDQPLNIGGIPPPAGAATAAVPVTAATTTHKPVTPSIQPDIQFFPEGGSMVNGVSCKVAFKAVNPDGSAASIQGNITDNEGQVLAEIKSGHDGMGSFIFTPRQSKTYSATVRVNNTVNNASSQTVSLPLVEEDGFGLAVYTTASADTLMLTVTASPHRLAAQPGGAFYLAGRAGEKLVFTATGNISAANCNYAISRKQLPAGITRFTLFNNQGEPVNERIVFNMPVNKLSLQVKTDKQVYKAGEKTNLDLKALITGTGNPKPAAADFSVAVINESLTPADDGAEPTIFSQLLLSSELHGAIADPGYYFHEGNKNAEADIDLLMLTQGFRKLEWKQLTDTINKPMYIAENGLAISGVVKDKGGKPVSKAKVSLFIPKQHIAVDTLSDTKGRFMFSGLDITDTSPVMIKGRQGNNTDVDITLDQAYPVIKSIPTTSAKNNWPALVTQAMQKIYARQEQEYPLTGPRAKARQLKEITIKSRVDAKPDLSTSANLHGGGNANQIIMGKDLGNCIKLTDCLSARLNAVTVYDDGRIIYLGRGRSVFKYTPVAYETPPDDPSAPKSKTQPMAFFVDGALINTGMVNYINPNDIYSIEVLTSVSYTSIYGTNGFGGVILITTKRGKVVDESQNTKKAPGILSYVFNGYYKDRAFYTPKYRPVPNYVSKDTQSAIYWKPDLVTNKDGNLNVVYNNAGTGTYRVVIEGIDEDGNIGRQVYRYSVE